MENNDQGASIVLTDPPDLPRTLEPCPKCGAKPSKRQDMSGFGRKRLILCVECGHEFSEGK